MFYFDKNESSELPISIETFSGPQESVSCLCPESHILMNVTGKTFDFTFKN